MIIILDYTKKLESQVSRVMSQDIIVLNPRILKSINNSKIIFIQQTQEYLANSLQKLGKTDMCNFTFHTLILAEYTPLASTPDGVMSSFKACTYGSFWGAKVPNIPLLWSTEMPKNIYEIMNSQCNALMHKKDVITN